MPRDWEAIKSSRTNKAEVRKGYEQARLAFELGERVRALREASGLSQTELAKRIGSTQPSLARLEGGGVTPTLETLDRIASALGLTLLVDFQAASPTPRSRRRASA